MNFLKYFLICYSALAGIFYMPYRGLQLNVSLMLQCREWNAIVGSTL